MKSKRAKAVIAARAEFAAKVVTIVTGYPLDEFIHRRISGSLIRMIEADDVRQDVILSILRLSDPGNIFRLHDNGGLRPWLIAIVRNTVFGYVRKRTAKKRSGLFQRHEDDESETAWLELVPDGNHSPPSNAAAAEAREALQAAIAKLVPRHRRALKLLLEGHTPPEIAKLMYRSLASVRGFIRRGLEAMRGKMGAEANWFSDAKTEAYLARLLDDEEDAGNASDE